MNNFKLTSIKYISTVIIMFSVSLQAQKTQKAVIDEIQEEPSYKKRVLEDVEIDFVNSYYKQEGSNAAVTGGIGDEHLTDITPTLVVSIPLNADDILTVDAGVSAYTSASSSNLDPFDSSGASAGGGEEDDDEEENYGASGVTGTPWAASSGASGMDVWANVAVSYAHSSDDRNTVWNANTSFSIEYDYISFGFGGGITKLWNEKNTSLGVDAKIFIDSWLPKYPTELDSYIEAGRNTDNGFFAGVDILNQQGQIDKTWTPVEGFDLIQDKGRNTYQMSLSFSQILSKNAQISLFVDIVQQQGWLANPMQRVYFSDRDNYYIGNGANIPNYTSRTNTDVFQLADDIERLPDTRLKTPVGARFNYYVNEWLTLRTYYRYYWDDWEVTAHTAQLELPIKLGTKFTLYPSYRAYSQTAADYFAPYEQHVSTSEFYTSDFDLSEFSSSQIGFGMRYKDIFTQFKIGRLGLKTLDIKYSDYRRDNGLNAGLISFSAKFVLDTKKFKRNK